MIVLWILLLVLLHLAVIAGLLAVIFGLGGNFILLGLAAIVAWIGGFDTLGWTTLLLLLGLAILGEVVESFLGVITARRFGASKWGMVGAFAGGIVGAILGTGVMPLLGSLLGAFAGAFGGAFIAEMLAGREAGVSARAGLGALMGRTGATIFKLAIGAFTGFLTLRSAYGLI